ncbi:MAG: folate-binding protein YgfZ [Kordiimonas sp.]
MTAKLLRLENRAVIQVSGSDAKSFLQGLVTNDVDSVSADQAVYAAMLTPQGKFLYDMIIVAEGNNLLLDVEASRKSDLFRRLMMYKLRANVDLTELPHSVWALFDGDAEHGVSYPDPRHKSLHKRVIAESEPVTGADSLSFDTYEERRIRHGIPDSSRDMAVEKHFWLETNAEKLNGVSFTKGCYVGQELTARMKHRTTLKKKIVPVKFLTGTPKTGALIETEAGKKAGEVLTTVGPYALAYLRLEYQDTPLAAEGASITTHL